ncbi:MAG: polyprenyl synthetase family protein [Paludibacteraceae bacterium]|nr:polyprenyl synthetase family protein [Paludibacteraceae bacterium]
MIFLPEIQEIIKSNIKKISWSSTLAKGLYEPIDYVMSLGGKRIRPSLLLMSADAFGANPKDFVNQALAIEMFHNFTLLHDDVMDNAPVRRGKPTVHVKWGENSAILSGDAMLVKSYELLADGMPADKLPQVLALFSRTAREVCEGQQLDMEFESSNDVTEQEYLEMIRLKTAVLLAASLKIGAMLAGADDDKAGSIYDFGINVGLAFQLMDDLLDVYGDPATFGKQVGGDIKERKKTFLLINAYAKADASQRQRLDALLAEDDVDVKAVTDIYNEIDVKSMCESKMNEYLSKGLDALSKTGLGERTKQLEELACGLMNRKV